MVAGPGAHPLLAAPAPAQFTRSPTGVSTLGAAIGLPQRPGACEEHVSLLSYIINLYKSNYRALNLLLVKFIYNSRSIRLLTLSLLSERHG